MEIREVAPSEYDAVGELTVRAYRSVALDDFATADTEEYAPELRDVAGRAAVADVLVAVDGARLVGAVTYVPDVTGAMAEFDEPDTASIRMLAVDPGAQGAGVGKALALACVERARAAGRTALLLHSTEWMTAAHRMYEGLGFRRDTGNDLVVNPDLKLRAYRLDLA